MPTTALNTLPAPFSTEALQRYFEEIFAELNSRVTRFSRWFRRHQRDEAKAEMVAFCWRNLCSKAQRDGVLLSASQLAFMAFLWVRNGRTIADYSTVDVHAPMAFRMGRSRVIHLSELHGARRDRHVTESDTVRVVRALSTSERESPAVLAGLRIDWAALSETLDVRLRKILAALAIGERKAKIAKALNVSAGRISQLIDDLGREIIEFFSVENLPSGLALHSSRRST